MESLCVKLLKSIFILPFCAGNLRRRRNGLWNYDCTISSRVLFLIIVAVVIVFTASREIQTHVEVRLGFVLLLLTVIMLSTICGMCHLGWLVQKDGLLSIVSAKRDTRTPKLQVVFLWVFGIGSGLYCALFVGKQIECSVLTNGGFYWHALFYFNILLTISIFTDLIFLSYFSPFELKQTTSVNFAMFITLTANVTVILYIYLLDGTLLFVKIIDPDVQLISCIDNNSTMTILLDKSRRFLAPTFVEFALLSTTLLLDIWSLTQVYHPDSGSTSIEINDRDNSEQTTFIQSADNQDSEQICLLSSVTCTNDDPNQAYRQHAAIEPYHSENGDRRKVSQIVTLVGSLTAGLGLVVCYTAQAMAMENIKNIRYATEIYELTLAVVMVLVIFVGFFCLTYYCTPDRSAKHLRPSDYVYLLSAFGVIMLHFYEALGGDVSSDSAGSIILYRSIISLFQDYLQVVFLLQANRCKKSRSSVDLLESVLIFTMIINIIFWFNNSFLLAEFPSTSILENDHFSKELLGLVYKVLIPVAIFFRFTSFLEFYATFEKYRSQE
ncbi:uncharacterized protein LOC110460133 [Mizuhopecten yessoensis]|uniref:uncharacterized protein LOC110460133 n=1 Tax=Mizuhopecten yessoensis TaxID=6573 RepID=UPI000B459539|nr:uncharacterized protein LOC110460133 [Mizuhopecten yessoensis]